MRAATRICVVLLWLSVLAPAGGEMCLSSPVSLVCPSCPVTLRCFTVDDWLDFFLPGWDGGL
ncbi:MAG: hypothetical protein ACP59X_04495 [Solidesulfovibrio sp. DCME]|uniref:hypothetical protein n=1 Tax=Solidesulfovibrio sp. DCME TaxID=3447380 RepID=UPI003D0AAA23